MNKINQICTNCGYLGDSCDGLQDLSLTSCRFKVQGDEQLPELTEEKRFLAICMAEDLACRLELLEAENFEELHELEGLAWDIAYTLKGCDCKLKNKAYMTQYDDMTIYADEFHNGAEAVVEFADNIRSSLEVVYAIHREDNPDEYDNIPMAEMLTLCPEEYDVSAEFCTDDDKVYAFFKNHDESVADRFLNVASKRTEPLRIAAFEVMEDIMAPDYVGGNSLDYCIENNLFYKAFSKGDLLYATFEEYLRFKKLSAGRWTSCIRAYRKETILKNYNARLKDGKRRSNEKRLGLDSCLFEVIKNTGLTSWPTPSSKSIRFVNFIDGNVPFLEFLEQEEHV